MIPAENKAVFLSYASQDAEAAQRIAEALRGAGLEVWFDKNELAGGDAWDAKIRKQIKECALFVPVISANTNARAEGYFRLEWKLAVDRSHLMADDAPFLFPIVIGDVAEAAARVPDRFRDVQWTRLRLDETPAEIAARVTRLLGGASPAVTRPASATLTQPDGGKKHAGWARQVWPFIGLAIGLVYALRPMWSPRETREPRAKDSAPAVAPVPPEPNPAASAAATAVVVEPVSEARRLAARAQALSEVLDGTRDDHRLAEELIAQAKARDATDAEVCAAEAHIHESFIQRGWDTSDARRENARSAVQRAMRLDPRSFEARFVQARLLGLVGREGEERARPLRDLRRERPTDSRVLRALATTLDRLGRLDEAAAICKESAALPGGDPLALYNLSQAFWFAGRAIEAEAMIEASLAQRPFTSALLMSAWYKTTLRGEIAQARALLERVDPAQLVEDRAAFFAYTAEMFARNAGKAIARLQAVPRDWLDDSWYRGPKGMLVGDAQLLAGRPEAARIEWQAALKLVEERLAERPKDRPLLGSRLQLLAKLGRRDEAAQVLPGLLQIAGVDPERDAVVPPALTYCFMAIGRHPEAVRQIASYVKNSPNWAVSYPSATLRLEPRYDPLREMPEFAAIIAAVEARERMVTAAPVPAPTAPAVAPAPAAPQTDDKSVAVLAFANLSDDKANEYFSDGISEELINTLGKVPHLKVPARTSSFYFKGRNVPVPEVAKQLGVAYVIEGSVQRMGEKVKISARLSKAADGFQVWADAFTRDAKDVFAVEEEIAGLIAKQLSLKLGVGSAAATASVNPEAFARYIQARQAWNLRTIEGFDRAETLLAEALELEPNFARAHSAMADVWSLRGQLDNTLSAFGRRDGAAVARVAAKCDLAIKLDPQSAEAHASRGILFWNIWRFAESEQALREAIRLNANYASAHQWLGRTLMMQGRLDDALTELQKATELDPLSPRIWDNYAWALNFAGRYREAIACCDRALAIQSTASQAMAIKAVTLADMGRADEAATFARMLPAGDSRYSMFRVIALGRSGHTEEVVRSLGQFSEGSLISKIAGLAAVRRYDEALDSFDPSWIVSARADYLLFHGVFDPMREDSRFRRQLAQLGLTEAHERAQTWRAAHPPERATK